MSIAVDKKAVGMRDLILADILGKSGFTRDDAAYMYAFLIKHHQCDCDWPRINRAIAKRWSRDGLEYIKSKAWKMMENETDRWGN